MLIFECVLIFVVVIFVLLGIISEVVFGDSKGKFCCKVDLIFFLKRLLYVNYSLIFFLNIYI